MNGSMRLIIFFNLVCLSFSGMSQANFTSTGKTLTNNIATVAYSLGQSFYVPTSNTAFSIAPGVQQLYDISDVNIPTIDDLNITVYPNPFQDEITLYTEYPTDSLKAKILDGSGRMINNISVTGKWEVLSFQNYPSGTYFITVSDEKNILKTFKIVKN